MHEIHNTCLTCMLLFFFFVAPILIESPKDLYQLYWVKDFSRPVPNHIREYKKVQESYLFDEIAYSRSTKNTNSVQDQVWLSLLQVSTCVHNKPEMIAFMKNSAPSKYQTWHDRKHKLKGREENSFLFLKLIIKQSSTGIWNHGARRNKKWINFFVE